MSALDKIKRGKRLTAAFLYELLYGIANGDLSTDNNNLPLWRDKSIANHVVEGCVWSGDSYGVNRNASMSAGTIMLDGQLIEVDAVANRTFNASNDTYVDVDGNGIYYTAVANNAASPALTAGRIRIGVIVAGATFITSVASINQGQPEKTVPTTCNLGKSGIDSLGNKICRRNPTKPLIFTFYNALQATGDITIATIPLLTNAEIVVDGGISARGVGAAPDVATYGRLYWDGTLVIEQRIDVQSSVAEPSYVFAWQQSTTAGSRILKINTATNAGALSHVMYALKVEVYA